jgi:Cys-rich protein (TIGR01571 family)
MSGQWNTSLCNCCSDCVCIGTCFAPMVFLGYNVYSIQSRSSEKDKFCVSCPDCAPIGACLLYTPGWAGVLIGSGLAVSAPQGTGAVLAIAGCISACLHGVVRNRVREIYGIDAQTGDCCNTACGDCCCALWCYSCAMAQEYRQLKRSPPTGTDSNGVKITTNSMMDNIPLLPVKLIR